MSHTPYETIRTPVALFPRQQVEFSGALVRAVSGIFDRLYTWQSRAQQRAHLAALDTRLLKDMGISQAAAGAEAAKPFWRA